MRVEATTINLSAEEVGLLISALYWWRENPGSNWMSCEKLWALAGNATPADLLLRLGYKPEWEQMGFTGERLEDYEEVTLENGNKYLRPIT